MNKEISVTTNREKLIIVLTRSDLHKGISGELEHHMNVDDREYEYDLADAFEDVDNQAECNGDKILIRECRKILIEVGYYKVMTQRDIDNTQVTRGTVWDFKMDGIPYTSRKAICEWIDNAQ